MRKEVANIAQGVSIVVCCYNSAKRLAVTLKHLANQTYDEGIALEIIIVNNGSTDGTKEIALQEWAFLQSGILFRVVDEWIPGLTAARNRGVNEANYSIVIFCDDDNWLNKDYVQLAYKVMKSDASIGILGCKIDAASDGVFPQWFERFKYAYAVGNQSESAGDISRRMYIWGAGMVFRKEIWSRIQELGIYTTLSDRKGNKLTSGGDSEFCILALILGYKLWYDPSIQLTHFIPKERLNWRYVKNLTKGFGASDTALVPLKLIYHAAINKDTTEKTFSWRSESKRMLLQWIKHPLMTIKGVIGGEGSSAAVWFLFGRGYLKQLLLQRSKLDTIFVKNLKILKDK